MDKKLLEYIKAARANGMTDGRVKEELSSVGWQMPDIEKALEDFNTREIESVKVERSSSGFKTVVFIIWAFLFVVLAVYVLDKIFNWGIM